jgi:putative CocE/NonD family hydrolase
MYASLLTVLLGLFVFRVLAQGAIALGWGRFLPPWEEWFSGLVPYRQLLVSQLLIVAIYGAVCVQFWRGNGPVVTPRPWLGHALLTVGSVYLSVMLIRYAIRMSLYPLERWTGGAIPIFFHWVLAAFLLTLGWYHRRSFATSGRTRLTRVALAIMWTSIVTAIAFWVLYQLAPALLAWSLGTRRAEYAVRIERATAMTTTDGIRLVADIYHPVRIARTPTILVRIPFSKTPLNTLFATVVGRFWAERGYTVVIQGTRGRYESGGRHNPLVDERRDGLDTLAWLRTQPWFDGRLGMWGGSAFGHTQWAISDQLPSDATGRSALIIQIASTDFHRMFYPGGAFSLESALFWAVRSRGVEDQWPSPDQLQRGFLGTPLIEADDRAVGDIRFFDDWVVHSASDGYWESIDGRDRALTLKAPVLLMAGWLDPFLPGQLSDFVRIRQHAKPDVASGTRLVIGPWGHAETVNLPGAAATRNYRIESLAPSIPWFDRHLRPDLIGNSDDAPVRLYVMGANVWRDEQEWPLARAEEIAWYLDSRGHANSNAGDGRLSRDEPAADSPADVFISNPASPVPTSGGPMLGGSSIVAQNDIEARPDVLVYTSAPLEADMEITGPVSAVLFVAATTPTADVTAKLVDVHPDGVAYNVSDGIRRSAYHAQPDVSTPAATEITVDLWPTSMVFRRGHRVRLEVAGANFPRFDRNPHTDEPPGTARTLVPATQAVHHTRLARSRLLLPWIPGPKETR